jgi:hypothetical protein
MQDKKEAQAYWVVRYRSDRVLKGARHCEALQTYAGPFPRSREAWVKAQELNDEHDRHMLRTQGPNEAGLMFSVLSDEEMAEAEGLGVHILEKRY